MYSTWTNTERTNCYKQGRGIRILRRRSHTVQMRRRLWTGRQRQLNLYNQRSGIPCVSTKRANLPTYVWLQCDECRDAEDQYVVSGRLCEDPQEIRNGRLVSDTSIFTRGVKVLYECDEGYKLVGESVSTCQAFGDKLAFQPQPPLCERTCP